MRSSERTLKRYYLLLHGAALVADVIGYLKGKSAIHTIHLRENQVFGEPVNPSASIV